MAEGNVAYFQVRRLNIFCIIHFEYILVLWYIFISIYYVAFDNNLAVSYFGFIIQNESFTY